MAEHSDGQDDGRDDGDEFDVVFDEDFVRAAPVSEPSAEERRRRAEAEIGSRQLRTRTSADIPTHEPDYEDGRPRRRRPLLVASAIFVVVAMVITGTYLDRITTTTRSSAAPTWNGESDGRSSIASIQTERPTALPAESAEPLGEPAPVPRTDGPFGFVRTLPDGSGPVTYDPCRTIRYVVDARDAPPGYERLVGEAIARVSEATGLVFEDEGSTTEAPTETRDPYQPDRYGERWAPVVIWWTTPESYAPLDGQVAGAAGSTSIEIDDPVQGPTATYLTGTVALDGPQLLEIGDAEGAAAARSVILHELGHLVGLDHVEDPTQIMNPHGSRAVTDFEAGDLRGLNELGRGTCITEL